MSASKTPALRVEIRAAMGGTDAARFVTELLDAYQRFATRRGWSSTLLDSQPGPTGGLRYAVLRLAGRGVDVMEREAGSHRVQRVPVNERNGRRHSSAITVAVLPDTASAGQVRLDPADLRVDTFRASGAGGQNVNKRSTAVRITHLPSGEVVACQEERSYHRNYARAITKLTERLDAQRSGAARQATEQARAAMVGSGNIAEHVRTYAFQRGQATDHRNGRSAPVGRVLGGELELLMA